jgi:hypothetical protein
MGDSLDQVVGGGILRVGHADAFNWIVGGRHIDKGREEQHLQIWASGEGVRDDVQFALPACMRSSDQSRSGALNI